MSFPNFVQSKLGESGNSTILQVIRVVNSVIGQLSTIFTYIKSKVQLDSVLLQNIPLKVGSNTVMHTLNRNWSGFQVVAWNGTYSQIVDAKVQPNATNYITLESSVATTVTLLVF